MTTKINISLPAELVQKVREQATKDDRKINQIFILALKQFFEKLEASR